jgi:Glyoxalase/Bleomycin resistance protein/Dioxygenase superfamily
MTKKSALEQMLGDCVQVGVVVRDVDRTVALLSDVFGIGPFRVMDWPPADRPNLKRFYHGKLSNYTSRMAWADLGAIELELIQPLEGQSIFREYLDNHGEGIHHLKFIVSDIESVIEHLSKIGIEASQRGEGLRRGTEWAFFDTERLLGFGIETMTAVPGTGGRTPVVTDGII